MCQCHIVYVSGELTSSSRLTLAELSEGVHFAVGSGDAAAKMAWHAIIATAARRFRPGLLMVSAGYDAHWQDPLEKQQFQSSTYHFLTQQLKLLADELCGRVMHFFSWPKVQARASSAVLFTSDSSAFATSIGQGFSWWQV